jgi:formate dehydrogenase gamma subunit
MFLALLAALLGAWTAQAADPEGCLVCHQYRGLSRLDEKGEHIRLFFVDPKFHNEAAGPHGRIQCTACHNRSEVEVFPHKPVSPVDCTRTCHLTTARNVETRFGHDRIDKMLDSSVHTETTLSRANQLLGSPLREGQARCLLCHDEPIFRKTDRQGGRQQAAISRCAVCHDDQLKMDLPFNYWHVQARSMPARDNLDLVRVCATCHSNEKIRAAFNLPDASISYLASFHGKASLLNNQDAASCLDCHVGEGENVHVMHAHTKIGAPTHPDQVANTCRGPACHRLAGTSISSAAIHVDLSRTKGIEWGIAVVFFGMILGTFGPSMVITLLKLINFAIGRDDPDHHHDLEKTQKLMADPEGRDKLRRFTLGQRLQHWYLVITFATLVITGFPMKFADRGWAIWVIHTLGGLNAVRWIHRFTGAALIVGFLFHMAYVLNFMRKARKVTGDSWFKIFFNLPLCMSPKDMMEMMSLLAFLVGLKRHRPGGARFTAEEKFEYFGVAWGTVLLGITGLLMWFNGWASRYIPGRILTLSNLVHSFEAFLALLHVGILHMATVIFSPVVFPISPAMFTGNTPPAEMAESHSELVDHVAGQVGLVTVGGDHV